MFFLFLTSYKCKTKVLDLYFLVFPSLKFGHTKVSIFILTPLLESFFSTDPLKQLCLSSSLSLSLSLSTYLFFYASLFVGLYLSVSVSLFCTFLSLSFCLLSNNLSFSLCDLLLTTPCTSTLPPISLKRIQHERHFLSAVENCKTRFHAPVTQSCYVYGRFQFHQNQTETV